MCAVQAYEVEDRQGARRSDGEGRCRSHAGAKITEGRKRKGSGRGKKEMSKGQVFERRGKCVTNNP